MDNFNNIIRSFVLLFVLAGSSLLSSCMKDDGVVLPKTDNGVAEGYMRIQLDLPDLHAFNPAKAGTKAMNNKAEREIRPELLNILVFKSDGNGTETFYYNAPIAGSITYDNVDGRKAFVTVKLVKSEDSNEKFRIVVVANHATEGVVMTENVTTKDDILKNLIYAATGIWNADDNGYTPFPMWGETKVPVEISENVTLDPIDMYRALARIDVGLNFETIDNVLSENALGLDAFKIKEIKVYRTYNKGFVAPLDATLIYVQPSIPTDAVRHDDNAPLEYTITETGGADKFVREIYVPEANLPITPSKSNMHCIVVGGYYKGSSNISYYRLNFAEVENGNSTTYYPILRNHRYIFNIGQITGPGYASAAEALNSDGFAGNIRYDLIVWDENIHEVQVSGSNYLGLDSRNVKLAANKHSTETPNDVTIKYQTNYPLSAADQLGLTWKVGSLFTAVWNEGSKNITISANTENVSNLVLSDTLYVTAGKITIPVRVEQAYVNFKYAIECSSVIVNGTYIAGSALNATHTIKLKLIAEDISIIGKKYIIETEELLGEGESGHGIRFYAEGTFNSTSVDVTLQGTGTPIGGATAPFNLQINSNSSNGSYCEATISPVSRMLNILVLGDIGNAHGYSISRLKGGAGQVFNHPNNFGPYDHSIVKISNIYYITSPTYDFSGSTSSDPYKWLTGIGNNGKIADLVYYSFPASVNDNAAKLLMGYLDKGGVVVAFMEDQSSAQYLARNLFNNNSITALGGGAAGYVYPFPAHPKLVGEGTEAQSEILRKYEADPILNGLFGDIRDKQWGEDVSATMSLYNFPVTDPNVTVYSYLQNLSATGNLPASNNVVAYKYESDTRNMVWFGDGGVMSSGYSGINGITTNTSDHLCPFWWNTTTMFPIPKPKYGLPSVKWDVYNSIAFCNIMAWAVNKSLSLQSKRDNL